MNHHIKNKHINQDKHHDESKPRTHRLSKLPDDDCKKFDIFNICVQTLIVDYTITNNQCFGAQIKMFTPVSPSFAIQNWGLRGFKGAYFINTC